jgi:hypothetical protein
VRVFLLFGDFVATCSCAYEQTAAAPSGVGKQFRHRRTCAPRYGTRSKNEKLVGNQGETNELEKNKKQMEDDKQNKTHTRKSGWVVWSKKVVTKNRKTR